MHNGGETVIAVVTVSLVNENRKASRDPNHTPWGNSASTGGHSPKQICA